MDRGADRHPWLVLASQWPDTNDEGPLGNFKISAEPSPRRDDPNVHGIFPGDHSRTPIARLLYLNPTDQEQAKEKSLPFLKQLGPNFDFGLRRDGADRVLRTTTKFRTFHPDLAHVTRWYWDQVQGQEVSYAENGNEFARYNPKNGEYQFPNLSNVPVDGQISSWGEVDSYTSEAAMPESVPPATERVELTSRLQNMSIDQIVPRPYLDNNTIGF